MRAFSLLNEVPVTASDSVAVQTQLPQKLDYFVTTFLVMTVNE